MARTIDLIKDEMATEFMANVNIQRLYGLQPNERFDDKFSRLSIEAVLMWIVAAAIWAHECIFDRHKAEVQELLDAQKIHTLRWYVEKAKAFRFGQSLIDGTDRYDDTGLSPADIADTQVVAAASASMHDGELQLKVAQRIGDKLEPLTAEQKTALWAYLKEVKDAGLRMSVITQPGDLLRLKAVVLYDPMLLDADDMSIETGKKAVLMAIKQHVEQLPFDSTFSRMALVDAMQVVPGVRVAEITDCAVANASMQWKNVAVQCIPQAGYFEFVEDNINITYTPYADYAD